MPTTAGGNFLGASKCERAKSHRFAYEVLEHELTETSPRNKVYTDKTEGKQQTITTYKILACLVNKVTKFLTFVN
jgi:hypothetical protein